MPQTENGPPRRRRRYRIFAGLAGLAALCALTAAPASAQPLVTGISGMGPVSSAALGEVHQTGSRMVRVIVPWQHVAPKQLPDGTWNPADPADPHYNWDFLDREMREVVAAGFEPLALVEGAPQWAQRCKSPPNLQYVEMCDPDPAMLAQFATAAARRYGGGFGNLPRVHYWQGLNEPNLTQFFFPQFSASGKPLSPTLYRALINSFYAAVKAVHPTNKVVMGGLGPIAIKGWTIGPMQFTRELLCMKGTSKPKPNGDPACAGGVRFDIVDIHPYTTGGPSHKGRANDVQLGDLKKFQTLIKAADRAGHIRGSGKHTQIWVAEFSWDSKPPDPGGVPMKILTRWVSEALHVSWQAGVSAFFWFSLRDDVPPAGVPYGDSLQAGFFFHGNPGQAAAKPTIQAYRFPFVAYARKGGKRLDFWGRTPSGRSAKVRLQILLKGRWKPLRTVRANASGIFRGNVRTSYGANRKGAVRAVSAGQTSAPFSMKPVRDFYVKPFG